MKNLFLGLVLLGSVAQTQAQFSTGFQPLPGQTLTNRVPYTANCWTFLGTDITSSSAINGFSTRSGQASSMTSKFEVITPFLNIGSGAQLSFKHKISSFNTGQPRYLDVVLINEAGQETSLLNAYQYTNGNVVTTNLAVNISGVYKIAMRHYGTGGTGRGHIDDFSITNTEYFAEPANGCVAKKLIVDSDGDGVADPVDEFPNDPNKAYTTYYPGQALFATIAFEDLWPYTGDYDFNDLVVDFRMAYVANAANQVVEIKTDVYVKAVGAGLTNGFGIELSGLSPSDIQSVSGGRYNGANVSLAANGTENGQSKAVIIPFESVELAINRVGGVFYNTLKSEAQGISDTIKMVISLANPRSLSAASSLNPFLFRNGNRGLEIHLAGYAPTDLADPDFFGTADDDSDPALGRYYKTDNNLPWALLIPQSFQYPSEKTDIVKAYLKFASWAQSGGSTYSDWYTNQPAYRNSELIF